ncbi:adrenodoxin-like protein 2, mitochondrial [Belonocnema kinseyi]|uniref:adrenodoxin-like protein 2, mitochondrial n=1 Tax=Belonocnema kinseyi TaxID=2817044 RepID=UPI00143CD622|nr:adrenodoxin-like protein 2, mitochondrial [Belonocnema kinseyi]
MWDYSKFREVPHKLLRQSRPLTCALQATVDQLFNQRASSRNRVTLSDREFRVKVTFIRESGERIEAKGKVGDTLLDIVVNNGIDLDGFGACQGTVTCSTCHLIIPKGVYENLPEKPSTDEIDMLDLVHEITETSRLGCQITMTKELDGLEVHVPCSIHDARSTDL